jgi:hypothetical protein
MLFFNKDKVKDKILTETIQSSPAFIDISEKDRLEAEDKNRRLLSIFDDMRELSELANELKNLLKKMKHLSKKQGKKSAE